MLLRSGLFAYIGLLHVSENLITKIKVQVIGIGFNGHLIRLLFIFL